MVYTEFRIKGTLDVNWSDWFGGMQIQSTSNGETILIGNLPDKSAVYGMLSKLSNLGIDLICVTCREIPIF